MGRHGHEGQGVAKEEDMTKHVKMSSGKVKRDILIVFVVIVVFIYFFVQRKRGDIEGLVTVILDFLPLNHVQSTFLPEDI